MNSIVVEEAVDNCGLYRNDCCNVCFHVLAMTRGQWLWSTDVQCLTLNNQRLRTMTVSRRCFKPFCSDDFAQFSPSSNVSGGGMHVNDCSLEFLRNFFPSNTRFWEAIVGQRRSIRRFDSMDIIVNFVVLRSPPQTGFGSRRILLDNATASAIDSTSIIVTFLFDSCSPPQTCKRFKEKIVEQPRWLGSWLNKCHWHILLNDSLLLFYSPPQTCKRFKEKIVRQCRSMRQFDCNLCPLNAGERSFNSLSFSCADLRLRKTLSTISECHPLRQCTWDKHRWLLLECCDIRKQFRTQLFRFFLLTQRMPIAQFESAIRWLTLIVWLCLNSAKLGNGYWTSR